MACGTGLESVFFSPFIRGNQCLDAWMDGWMDGREFSCLLLGFIAFGVQEQITRTQWWMGKGFAGLVLYVFEYQQHTHCTLVKCLSYKKHYNRPHGFYHSFILFLKPRSFAHAVYSLSGLLYRRTANTQRSRSLPRHRPNFNTNSLLLPFFAYKLFIKI